MAALVLLIAAPALAQTPPASPPLKWAPFIDLDGKAGTQRNIGEGDLFIPLLQNSDSMLFADLRGRFDDRSDDEGNFGLGFRHMLGIGWNLGAYGYYDRRSTALGSIFEQATFGAEALSLDWDVRANLYQPVGPSVRNISTTTTASSTATATSTTTSSTAALAGTAVDVTTSFLTTSSTTTATTAQTTQERAQGGFDGEIGWRVPVFAPEALTQLRVYAGGYRFTGNGVGPTEGPRGRLDLTIDQVPYLWNGARLDIGGELQHDTPRGTQAFAEIALRIPLQVFGEKPAELTAIERRMEDPTVRDVDVVAQSHSTTASSTTSSTSTASSSLVEIATATSGGSPITVLSSASTTGAALPGAVVAAGANSTVLLTGTFSTTATTTLQSGQALIGAGTLTVETPSGRTATLTTPMATVTGNLGFSNHTVTMANNSTLKGLIINTTDNTGNNALAVQANGVTGATIANNTINATVTAGGTAHGVDVLAGASNITVSGNTITATGAGGADLAIGVQVNNASATVTGNSLGGSGATTNATVLLSTANILTGSTGNVAVAGSCDLAAAGTGTTVTFTNAAACGP
ncbi:MAG TPA: inverse autotransporter beta domain-containing protein [Stellaceae bacterium]|jgi:hypothetical protein